MRRVFDEQFIVRCSTLHSGFSAYKIKFHQKYLTTTSTVQERPTFYNNTLSLIELQHALTMMLKGTLRSLANMDTAVPTQAICCRALLRDLC